MLRFVPPYMRSPLALRRWSLVLAVALAIGGATSFRASGASALVGPRQVVQQAQLPAAPTAATASAEIAACADATRAKPLAPLAPVPAVGLPAGTASVVPEDDVLPAGFTLKHAHGGPTYVYVLSGAIAVTDEAGRKSYCAGAFLTEPPGHTHTLDVLVPSEIFVLYLLPPGAAATIPVQ